MVDNNFKLKLIGPGMNYETDIDAKKASDILQICLISSSNSIAYQQLQESQQSLTPQTIMGDTSIRQQTLSLAEYYNNFNPKRNPDKILCFAGYIKNILKRDEFEPEEIKAYFQKSGEIKPKNFGRDFRWAITNGWIDETLNNPGHFYITNSGKKTLESNFDQEILKKTTLRRKKKKEVKDSDN
jgi:hypothetical protein